MRKLTIASTSLMLVMTLAAPTTLAADEGIEEELRSVVEENFSMAEAEDLEKYMDTTHPQSPTYQQTRKLIQQMMDRYDLDYELLSFNYIGEDGKYQLARVKQKTTNTSEAAFRDNITVNLWAFRKHDGEWKSWNTMLLEREFIDNQS